MEKQFPPYSLYVSKGDIIRSEEDKENSPQSQQGILHMVSETNTSCKTTGSPAYWYPGEGQSITGVLKTMLVKVFCSVLFFYVN